MENKENGNFDVWKDILERQAEESRIREAEMQIRYGERKRCKQEQRRAVEAAAAMICTAIEKATKEPDKLSPEELAQISAALNHVAAALQTAEQYAEYTPYYGAGIGLACAG